MRDISEFLPDGVRMRSPGDFQFDPAAVSSVEVGEDRVGPYMTIHRKGHNSSLLRFHRRSSELPVDHGAIARGIWEAHDEAVDTSRVPGLSGILGRACGAKGRRDRDAVLDKVVKTLESLNFQRAADVVRDMKTEDT